MTSDDLKAYREKWRSMRENRTCPHVPRDGKAHGPCPTCAEIDSTITEGFEGAAGRPFSWPPINPYTRPPLTDQPTAAEKLEEERDRERALNVRLRKQLADLERARDSVKRELDGARVSLAGAKMVEHILRGQLDRALSAPSQGLDASLLSKLIRLCHPDRHAPAQAGMANEVTAQLLKMRGKK